MQPCHLTIGSLINLGQEIIIRPGGCEVSEHIFRINALVLLVSALNRRLHFGKQAQIRVVVDGLSGDNVLGHGAHLGFCSVFVAF